MSVDLMWLIIRQCWWVKWVNILSRSRIIKSQLAIAGKIMWAEFPLIKVNCREIFEVSEFHQIKCSSLTSSYAFVFAVTGNILSIWTSSLKKSNQTSCKYHEWWMRRWCAWFVFINFDQKPLRYSSINELKVEELAGLT